MRKKSNQNLKPLKYTIKSFQRGCQNQTQPSLLKVPSIVANSQKHLFEKSANIFLITKNRLKQVFQFTEIQWKCLPLESTDHRTRVIVRNNKRKKLVAADAAEGQKYHKKTLKIWIFFYLLKNFPSHNFCAPQKLLFYFLIKKLSTRQSVSLVTAVNWISSSHSLVYWKKFNEIFVYFQAPSATLTRKATNVVAARRTSGRSLAVSLARLRQWRQFRLRTYCDCFAFHRWENVIPEGINLVVFNVYWGFKIEFLLF